MPRPGQQHAAVVGCMGAAKGTQLPKAKLNQSLSFCRTSYEEQPKLACGL